ncbi:apoptosis regulator BAX-like [Babylonia areolata]|uniref:apoptosis regulator BAX-like n=1 Tax=Babylonia areolata TaxID=304850 RepID=UPI003FD602F3
MTKELHQHGYNLSASVLLSTDTLSAQRSAAGDRLVESNPFDFTRAPSRNVTMATATGGQTLVSRRPSSQGLPRLRISPSRDEFEGAGGRWEEDVEEQGKQLFSNFVYDQVRTESPEAVRDIAVLTPAGYANPMWAKAGRELRHMADIFAETAERRRVKQKASEVSTNISYEEFKDLLTELFAAGGITKERIVVLFFFCSDVAIRSLRRGAHLCQQFLRWSFSFVTDSVCSWVRSHGGWGEVMSSSFNSLPRVLLFAAVIALGVGVIRYINRP